MAELRALGYEYKSKRLVQVGTDQGFAFQSQEHYERLADAVLRHVGNLLVEEAKLAPVPFPLDAGGKEPSGQIYVSQGIKEADRVLLLIQGSGRVRVGVWGCALCINKDLDMGTCLPYLQLAKERGYGVIVLNPNENVDAANRPIRGSETPWNHVGYVWHQVVGQCKPGAIVDVVAHSNGGMALLHFLGRGDPVAQNAAARIRRVVLTDSYHSPEQAFKQSPAVRAAMQDRTRWVNYVPHKAPLGTPVDEWDSLQYHFCKRDKGCECLSAAVEDHAATNQAALQHAFMFLSR
jgi:hypothetical protein